MWLRRWADRLQQSGTGANVVPGVQAPYRRCSLAILISAQASKYSKLTELTAKELLAVTKLFPGCNYERKRLWMNFRFQFLKAEETMGLTNLPEYISAIVAIIALFISCYQARLSNKQSLFNRRLNIWITVNKLMSVYANNAKNFEHNDEPEMAINLLFVLLTNTTYLQSISTSINQVLDAGPQLKLHLKLDEMRSLAMEARFCFKGKSGDAIADFIEAYQSLLFSIYQYQILLNKMSQSAKEYQWTLEQASEKLHEPDQRKDLFEKESALATSYKNLCQQNKRGAIQRQIQLAGPIWR